jgi:topoisomerase-4 subunit A
VQDKVFVGKDIIHVAVFKKNDERTVYNMIYKDGESGIAYIKRFSVVGVTRDKEYDLTKGTKGTKVLYFTANSNGEAEIVNVQLKPHSKLKKLQFDEDFASIAIKGRGSMGNIITKYPVKKIVLKSKGISTLAGRKIWYDEILKRLNADGRGKYLGEFDGDDRILNVLSTGLYELTNFDLNNHFDDKMILIEKYDPKKVFSVIHLDGKSKNYMVKRFVFETIAIGKQVSIISDEPGSKLLYIAKANQLVKVVQLKGKEQTPETIEVNLADLIDVKGMKAMGNRLSQLPIKSVELIATEDVAEEPVEDEDNEAEESVETNIEAAEAEPETEQVKPETPATKSAPKQVESPKEESPKTESAKSPEPEAGEASNESSESPPKPAQTQTKKIDFEITNPDDIDIDDKGQLGLF